MSTASVRRGGELSEAQLFDLISALIAYFIWMTHRGVCQASSSGLQVCVLARSCENYINLVDLQSVLRIFIESAGIWVLFIFITFMIYLANENASYIFLYLVCLWFHA